jgi:hypothetical protein
MRSAAKGALLRGAAKGALILKPNYRGSAGYGEHFRALNVRNLGLGDYVVVAMGNNGTFTSGQFDEIMSIIGPSRKAIFVTVKVARS